MKTGNRSLISSSQTFQATPKTSFLIPQGELELFHYMMDHIGDEVLVVRRDGRIVFANQATVKKLGYPRKVLLDNKLIMDLFRERITLPQWQKIYWDRVKRKGAPVSFIVECVGKGGGVRTMDVTAVYMQYKSEEYLLSVARDITEQLMLQQRLKESEKMKALQNFIAGTVQEIQHPLKSILDHSQALVGKYKDRHFEYVGYKEFKDIMQTLEAIRDQVRYCFDTTDKLLDINRRKVNLKGGYCNVNEVVRAAIKGLRQSFEVSGICPGLRLAGHLPLAAIGALEFSQVMTNILTNAIQAMPRGGVLHIRTFEDKGDRRESLAKSRGDRKIHIECRDEGVGISPEDLPRVFEPFFTTKHRGLAKSAGLGLTIAYSITRSFQGEIVVKSRLREGTVVRISFPVYRGSGRRLRSAVS